MRTLFQFGSIEYLLSRLALFMPNFLHLPVMSGLTKTFHDNTGLCYRDSKLVPTRSKAGLLVALTHAAPLLEEVDFPEATAEVQSVEHRFGL